MARELGMNPAKFGKLDNYRQESWKAPLPQFIEELYYKRFGKTVPDSVISIDSGDAWILDPADDLATRIAENGAPRPVHIEETETNFAVGWQGRYKSAVRPSSLSTESGRVPTILGYPIQRIADQIVNIVG